MPTISVDRNDLECLLGRAAPSEDLHAWLSWAKGELKGEENATGELRIELQDSNRPDLWSCEGIARQIRAKLAKMGKFRADLHCVGHDHFIESNCLRRNT